MTSARFKTVLIFLIALAFFVRFWGIWNVSTTDEYNEVFEALRVCAGHLNYERWIKRLYLYLLAFQYGVYFCGGWLLGVFHSPMDFAEKIIRNMEPLFLIGRFTSVVAGTLTVWVVYVAGRRFFNERVGLIAAALLCLTVFHIDLSQQAKVDALLGLLVTSCLYFILRMYESKGSDKRLVVYCAVLMAFAVQTKVNSAVLIVPFLTSLVFCRLQIKAAARVLLLFGFAFVAGFVIANPPVLVAPEKFIANMIGLTNVYSTPVNTVPSESIGFVAYPVFFFREMGPVVAILTIAGLWSAIVNPTRQTTVLLSFLVPFYVVMGSLTSLVAPYYLIPIAPILFLLAGRAGDRLLDWGRQKFGILEGGDGRFIGIATAVLLVVPMLSVALHVRSVSGPNTRYLARDWIEANIPANAKILMDSGKSINSSAPPIAENQENLALILQRARENIKEGRIVHEMVDSNALIYYELLQKTVPKVAYDITSTMFGLKVESIDYYASNGFSYLIISESMKESRTSEYARKNTPLLAEFYGSLDTDKRVTLIKDVAPGLWNRGDRYLIYAVKPSGA